MIDELFYQIEKLPISNEEHNCETGACPNEAIYGGFFEDNVGIAYGRFCREHIVIAIGYSKEKVDKLDTEVTNEKEKRNMQF